MNPRLFLLLGGAALVTLGVLGFLGITGPTPEQSIFGTTWWFDDGENWAHTVIGIVGIVAAFAVPVLWRKYFVILLGVVALFFGIYSLFESNFLGSTLENPMDTLLHLIVGAWALLSSGNKEE